MAGEAARSPGESSPGLEALFPSGSPGRGVVDPVLAVLEGLDGVRVRVGRSQVTIRAHRAFAFLWAPARHLRSEVPAVLSLALPAPVGSPRFEQVVHPAPRVWVHHLELHGPGDVDAEVRRWLTSAYEHARLV
jgi:hypothetical protein